MNIRKPVAFVKADLNTLNFMQLKQFKPVNIWYKNELLEMTMVDWTCDSEQSLITISDISSLPVFLIDANGLITVYQEDELISRGRVLELTSIEASKKDFFIKDIRSEKFYGVLS